MERRDIMLNTKSVLSAYDVYEGKSTSDIQEELKPIIKRYGAEKVSEHTGLTKHTLYRYCKKLFVEKGMKPDFISYCKVLQCEKDFNNKEKRRIKRNGKGN